MRTRLFKIAILTVACCGIVAFFGGDTTYAATKTWTGGGDGSTMSDPSNWSNGATPANGDDLIFDDAYGSWVGVDNDIVGLNLNSITIACSIDDYNGAYFYNNAIGIASSITNSNCSNYASFESSGGITLIGNATFSNLNVYASSGYLDIGTYALTAVGPSFIYGDITGTGVINAIGTPMPATVEDILVAQLTQPDQVQMVSLVNFSGTINVNTLFVTGGLAASTATININQGGVLAVISSPAENVNPTINVYNPNVSVAFVCQGTGADECDGAPSAVNNINLFTDTTIVAIQMEDLSVATNKINLSGLNHNDHCLTLQSVSAYELAYGIGSDIVSTDPANFFTGVTINPLCGNVPIGPAVPTVPDVGYSISNNPMQIFALITTTSSAIILIGVIAMRRTIDKEGK